MYEIIDTEFVRVAKNTSIVRVVILCDTSSDIPKPLSQWSVGSICRVANENKTVILNNAREWV
ncbi:MAG: hypothetical protein K2G63_03430 [Oscillospiraceae bacterium]|nr:hypothetical protein [Oscillospiraceae bacterium]